MCALLKIGILCQRGRASAVYKVALAKGQGGVNYLYVAILLIDKTKIVQNYQSV